MNEIIRFAVFGMVVAGTVWAALTAAAGVDTGRRTDGIVARLEAARMTLVRPAPRCEDILVDVMGVIAGKEVPR